MKGLQDKVALVTGGSSGIGQAIAIRLGDDGASVAINYVGRSDGAITTKEAIEHGVEICMKKVAEAGGRPILVGADVSDEHAVEQMFDRVMSEYGRLDILVNNAGIQIAEDSHELSAADFDKVLAVNLRGAFLCAREAVRSFLAAQQPGVIVNVSSVHQVIPEAAVPRLLGVEGRHAEPHPVAGAGVRRTGNPGQRHRPGRDRHADQPVVDRRPGQAAHGGKPHPDAAGGRLPRRWPRRRRSCAPTRRRTSPGRRCSSTAASPCTPPSRPPGPPSYLAARISQAAEAKVIRWLGWTPEGIDGR